MRASLLIAAHNEGELLWKTIRACLASISDLEYEILVADDASSDGSLKEARRRFPQIRVVRHPERRGASPTKHLAAAESDVLIGQQMSLLLTCDRSATLTELQWSTPIKTAANYAVVDGPTTDSATVTQLTATDLNQAALVFYWVTAGTKAVSVSFKHTIDDITTSCSVKRTFTCYAPAVTTTAPTSIGEVIARGDDIRLLIPPGPVYGQGITFTAAVTTPDPDKYGGNGSWQFTQLVVDDSFKVEPWNPSSPGQRTLNCLFSGWSLRFSDREESLVAPARYQKPHKIEGI